jgi:hypothetical protein
MTAYPFFLQALIAALLLSCGEDNSNTFALMSKTAGTPIAGTTVKEGNATGIVGEWKQEYTSYDRNNNYLLDKEERKPSGTMLGFDYFRFNKDGSCIRDKDIKWKGTYEVVDKGSSKKLVIHTGNGDGDLKYTIYEPIENELILGVQGAFMVFKRME